MGNDALRAAQSPCLPETSETFYTLQEAAQELGVRVLDLEHAIQSHRLPFIHQFGRKLIAASDLDAYRIRQQPVEQAAPSH